MNVPVWLWAAATAAGMSLGIAVLLLALPAGARLPASRRRPAQPRGQGVFGATAVLATGTVGRALGSRAERSPLLDLAGLTVRVQDLVLGTVVGALAVGGLGWIAVGPLALLLTAVVPVGVRVWVEALVSHRRRAFADQLDDALQLMAGSLRAGHSLLQSLASVAEEAESPTAEEFGRVVNETRVGRDLGSALAQTAERTANQDFVWVAQAIAINREVGGNLAEVLDRVGHTIRERNGIRRQVKALSAEGKMSALVLMALPVGITLFLSMINPGYLAIMVQQPLGWVMIALAVIMFGVGGWWLRVVTTIRF